MKTTCTNSSVNEKLASLASPFTHVQLEEQAAGSKRYAFKGENIGLCTVSPSTGLEANYKVKVVKSGKLCQWLFLQSVEDGKICLLL